MTDLKVILERDVYCPGEQLAGKVKWSAVSDGSESLAIRMLWYTQGKGDRDYKTMDSVELSLTGTMSVASFEFVVPHRPISFSGKLISLHWGVEVVVNPSKQSALAEFALCDQMTKIVLQDKSKMMKELGIKKPFFSMGSK